MKLSDLNLLRNLYSMHATERNDFKNTDLCKQRVTHAVWAPSIMPLEQG